MKLAFIKKGFATWFTCVQIAQNDIIIQYINMTLATLVSSRNCQIMQIESISCGVQQNGIMVATALALGDGRC